MNKKNILRIAALVIASATLSLSSSCAIVPLLPVLGSNPPDEPVRVEGLLGDDSVPAADAPMK